MKKFSLLLLLAIIFSSLLTPSPALANHVEGDLDCSDFSDFQKSYNFFWNINGESSYDYYADSYHLDGDRDYTACESLAVSTPAPGEPECTGFIKKNCSGRDTFRKFWHFTLTRPGPALQQRAVLSSMTSVYGPIAKGNSQVNSVLAMNYEALQNDISALTCQRWHLRNFIIKQTQDKNMVDGFVKAFAVGETLFNRKTYPAKLVEEYMKLGGEAAKAASQVALSESARIMLTNTYFDCHASD